MMKKLLPLLLLVALSSHAGEWCFNESEGLAVKGTVPASLNRLDENTTRVPGRSGYAIHFGGKHEQRNVFGAVTIAMDPKTFTGPFTIEMWVKFDKDTPYRAFKDLIGNSPDRGPGFRITYYYGSLQVRTGDGKKVQSVATNSSTSVIYGGQWNQLVVVYDGSLVRIYINGEEKASGELRLTKGRPKLSVGSYSYGAAYPMNGALDELKIYASARTAAEVAQSYLKGIQ